MKKRVTAALMILSLTLIFCSCMKKTGVDKISVLLQSDSQGSFWKVAERGAKSAAEDFNCEISIKRTSSENAPAEQVQQLETEAAGDPAAICIAAIDTGALAPAISKCAGRGIPLISMTDTDPSYIACAAADNAAACDIAAQKMYTALSSKLSSCSPDAPLTIAVLSNDFSNTEEAKRAQYFVYSIKKLLSSDPSFKGSLSVKGDRPELSSISDDPSIIIYTVSVTLPNDLFTSAKEIIESEKLGGVFCTDSRSAEKLIEVLRTVKTRNLPVIIGFNSGSSQKTAVRTGIFLGSVTQDAYAIGYQAVALAASAAQGKPLHNVDTGVKWYDASNIDSPDISELLNE